MARCTWHCSAAQCAQLLSLSCICSGSLEGGRWSASGALGAGSRSPQPAPLLGGCACNWSTFVWQITPWHPRTAKYINENFGVGDFTLILATCPNLTILTCVCFVDNFHRLCELIHVQIKIKLGWANVDEPLKVVKILDWSLNRARYWGGGRERHFSGLRFMATAPV